MYRETFLEIDADRLEHNLRVFRNLIHPKTRILANLKGNAYGMDAVLIGQLLEQQNIDYFSVAYINEGIRLRKADIKGNIIVFNPSLDNFEDLISYNLEPEVSSIEYLKKLIAFLERKNIKQYPIHLKLDTGMKRAGIEEKDLDELIKLLKDTLTTNVKSVFSHLAASEEPSKDTLTRKQFRLFDKMTNTLENRLNRPFFRHILNTAGVFRFPEKQYDMIRPGLGIFGYNLIEKNKKELLPIARLLTKINQIKTLKKGEALGYNHLFVAPEDQTKVALLPIGYADGLNRKLGNGRWSVKIRNKECPIIGAISMDTLSIDITSIEAKAGDEVVIFDNDKDVYKMANILDTIPYEITTSLSSRVEKRLTRIIHRNNIN